MNNCLSRGVILLLAFLGANVSAATPQNLALAPHAADLVCLQGNKLSSFHPREFLEAPWTILYFGAGWCPDCRKFSPALVAAYDRQPPRARRFEVLYLSQDRSETEMLQFMAKEKMRWPALAYAKVSGAEDLAKYHPNKSIPWLAVIDQHGTVLLHSESDKDGADVLNRFLEKLDEKR